MTNSAHPKDCERCWYELVSSVCEACGHEHLPAVLNDTDWEPFPEVDWTKAAEAVRSFIESGIGNNVFLSPDTTGPHPFSTAGRVFKSTVVHYVKPKGLQ